MRFCGECKLNVFNLSGMTRTEAEDLIARAEGRLCVRFYRRPDGSIITENCPVGWARVIQRAQVTATAALSILTGFFGGLFAARTLEEKDTYPVMGKITAERRVETEPKGEPLMGAIAVR